MLAYRVNCVREIVRVSALAVRDGNGLELGREFPSPTSQPLIV